MSEPRTPPERIDLAQADDPRDVVHRAVACLAQGGVVGLATETVYGVAACALQPAAVARLRGTEGSAESNPWTLLLRGPEEVADWVPDLSEVGRRLARRAWPGPVCLTFSQAGVRGLTSRLPDEVREQLSTDSRLDFGVSAHPFVREVLRLLPAPLVFSPIVAPDPAVPTSAETLSQWAGLDMLIDTGPTRVGKPATIVRVGPEGWEIVRQGAVDAAALTRMAGTILLFVCTGNTCRSPMAEAICKLLLAQRLGCPPDQLETRGHVVLSAGVAAMKGMPAAANAIEVVRAWGGSLQHHASRPISTELILHADLIVAMTSDHLETLLEQAPECAPRARLLHPHGGDVADPVGSDRETYLRTAEDIREYLGHLLDELGI